MKKSRVKARTSAEIKNEMNFLDNNENCIKNTAFNNSIEIKNTLNNLDSFTK